MFYEIYFIKHYFFMIFLNFCLNFGKPLLLTTTAKYSDNSQFDNNEENRRDVMKWKSCRKKMGGVRSNKGCSIANNNNGRINRLVSPIDAILLAHSIIVLSSVQSLFLIYKYIYIYIYI